MSKQQGTRRTTRQGAGQAARQKQNPKRTQRTTVILLVSLLVLAYFGYQVYLVASPTLSTEVAYQYTVSDSVDTTAFVVRNEAYLQSDGSGTIISVLGDGSRVSKGEEVAAVFTEESDAATYATMISLKEDLARYQRLNSQNGSYAVNVSSMNESICKSVIDLVNTVDSGNLDNLSDQVYDVRDKIITRQIATGENLALDSIISGITSEYSALTKQNGSFTRIRSDASGYYVSGTDGYESAVDYDSVSDLTVDDIQKLLKAKASSVPENTFGKLFEDFDWYLVCVADTNKVGNLSVGSKVTVQMPYSSVGSVPAEVVAINASAEDKKTALIFRSNYMSSDIAQLRKEEVQIVMDTLEGLKINSKAIRVNDDGDKGVYVKSGNTCKFKKVDIIYSDSGWVLSKVHEESGYVSLYDEIILEGKDLYDGKIIS